MREDRTYIVCVLRQKKGRERGLWTKEYTMKLYERDSESSSERMMILEYGTEYKGGKQRMMLQ